VKKIGIVADNYKVEMFGKELEKAGFKFSLYDSIGSKLSFTKDTTIIQVWVPNDRVQEVRNICELVELHFKRSS
jgi:hypothetical protein